MNCLRGQNKDSQEACLFSSSGKPVFKNVRNTENRNTVGRESVLHQSDIGGLGAYSTLGFISHRKPYYTDVFSACRQDSLPATNISEINP